MTSQNTVNDIFDKIPRDMEHRMHEYLRIAEVCALQGVSKSWHSRARHALRHTYRWDLTHVEGVDMDAGLWLEHVTKANVSVRSLRMRVEDLENAARHAAALGLADAMKMLITYCPSTTDFVNAKDYSFFTPLHYGVMGGYRNIIELLLAMQSVDVNATDYKGFTPLHHGVMGGHCNLVELLLAMPNTDVNARDRTRSTPLLHVATKGHRDIVELLLAVPNIDVKAGNREKSTPLDSAAMQGHHDIVELLVAVPHADVNAADNQ